VSDAKKILLFEAAASLAQDEYSRAGLMFESRTQARLLHVPYKGGALAINGTIGGTFDEMFAVMPEAVPHVKTGKLHAELLKTALLVPH
jgi:tripartite-type tricarboxylate transporter receptor subunit TctC